MIASQNSRLIIIHLPKDSVKLDSQDVNERLFHHQVHQQTPKNYIKNFHQTQRGFVHVHQCVQLVLWMKVTYQFVKHHPVVQVHQQSQSQMNV